MGRAAMTKPASAPPDTLQAIADEMRQFLSGRGNGPPPCVTDWADRIEALAASAQVRDGEASALAWMGRTAESLGVASRDDGLLTLARALTDWIDTQRAAEPDAADWQSEIRRHDARTAAEPVPATINSSEIDSKLIGEPAPVAQGDGSVLAFVRVMRNLRERYPADADVVESYSNILQAAIIKQAEARTALEASLAACRAHIASRVKELRDNGDGAAVDMCYAEVCEQIADELEAVLPLAGEVA